MLYVLLLINVRYGTVNLCEHNDIVLRTGTVQYGTMTSISQNYGTVLWKIFPSQNFARARSIKNAAQIHMYLRTKKSPNSFFWVISCFLGKQIGVLTRKGYHSIPFEKNIPEITP